MATLWWLGYTANGDCNQAANWTYYGPGSSGYAFGIQPSANIPKYNDTVIFDRISFTTLSGETGTYPIYSSYRRHERTMRASRKYSSTVVC